MGEWSAIAHKIYAETWMFGAMMVEPMRSDPNRPFDMNRLRQFIMKARQLGSPYDGSKGTMMELSTDVEKDISAMIHRLMAVARIADTLVRSSVPEKDHPPGWPSVEDDPELDTMEALHTILMMCHEEISADAAMERLGYGFSWARGPLPRQVKWYV